jgi:hypothetical protein
MLMGPVQKPLPGRVKVYQDMLMYEESFVSPVEIIIRRRVSPHWPQDRMSRCLVCQAVKEQGDDI